MATGQIICVNDRMQKGYSYVLSAREGEEFAETFKPHFTPAQMLELGVFEGKYLNDCQDEFPPCWFENAKLARIADPALNCFAVKSRQSLTVWRQKGWIIDDDPRGWFQWYCRYFLGRRLPAVDEIQIRRWKGFSRHSAQLRKNCQPGDVFCRPRQRQALLQWAHNPFV